MAGYDDGRKRRFAAEGGDRRWGGFGRRLEDAGRAGGGQQGGGGGLEGGGGCYRYLEDLGSCGGSCGREAWSSPPLRWREQRRWERGAVDRYWKEEVRLAQGERVAGGQGDQGGNGQR
nr:glycine-rich RNA-binding protein-like [Lolium perenne]